MREINPLLSGDLEGAAYLCLAIASTTDRDQFSPGSGDMICRKLHERRVRFEKALAMMQKGAIALSELGLSSEDCAWAACFGRSYARDPEGWFRRFQIAENDLKKVHA